MEGEGGEGGRERHAPHLPRPRSMEALEPSPSLPLLSHARLGMEDAQVQQQLKVALEAAEPQLHSAQV